MQFVEEVEDDLSDYSRRRCLVTESKRSRRSRKSRTCQFRWFHRNMSRHVTTLTRASLSRPEILNEATEDSFLPAVIHGVQSVQLSAKVSHRKWSIRGKRVKLEHEMLRQDSKQPQKLSTVSPLTVLVDMTLRHHISIQRNLFRERYILPQNHISIG